MSLKDAAEAILEELQDRYDGAPDSRTLWMGSHIAALEAGLRDDPTDELIEACRRFIEAWERCHQLEKTDVAVRLARTALDKAEGRTAAEIAEDDHLRDMIRGRIDHA